MANVTKNEKQGYINKEGNELVPVIYDSARYYPEYNIVIVEKEGKIGCINIKTMNLGY